MFTVREVWDDLATRAGLSRVSPRVVAIVGAVAVLACGWAVWQRQAADGAAEFSYESAAESEGDADPGDAHDASEGAQPTSSAGSEETSVVVHVAGAVLHPGIVRLAPGARVADALEGAGGALGEAALDAVNLARVIEDGEQIYIPTQDELAVAPGSWGGPVPGGATASAPESGSSALVNINTADVAQLDTLPGVGPSTAEKIVADRDANGPFATSEDLMRVSGIGEKRFEELQDLITTQ